jgi:hypothetical protein
MYKEPLMARRSRRDVRRSKNATTAQRTEAEKSTYVYEARGLLTRLLGRLSCWRSSLESVRSVETLWKSQPLPKRKKRLHTD